MVPSDIHAPVSRKKSLPSSSRMISFSIPTAIGSEKYLGPSLLILCVLKLCLQNKRYISTEVNPRERYELSAQMHDGRTWLDSPFQCRQSQTITTDLASVPLCYCITCAGYTEDEAAKPARPSFLAEILKFVHTSRARHLGGMLDTRHPCSPYLPAPLGTNQGY